MNVNFEVSGFNYTAESLSLRQQFLIAKRLGLAFGMLGDVDKEKGPAASVVPFILAMGTMSDAEATFIMDSCLAVTKRLVVNSSPAPLGKTDAMMFSDIGLAEISQIVCQVLEANLGNFFVGLRAQLGKALGAKDQALNTLTTEVTGS